MADQKTVLVAGAAGFLGSHLSEQLLKRGYRVIGLDNFITGTKDNFKDFADQPGWSFVEHDLIKPLPPSILEADLWGIANLACPASPVDYQERPLETMRVSSVGVDRLLALAKDKGARFTHTSTSEVYGDPLEHPQKESYWGNVNSYGERSCYDEGKRFAEALIYSWRHKEGANTGISRIFNTYGPRMRPSDGRVISNFIRQALAGEPLTIYGDGSQTRSFCFVDDQIRGQIALLESDLEGPVNIGNPVEFTILELAETVQRVVGGASEIVRRPLPADDPKRRQPDITKAKAELDWEPSVSLEEGVGLMVAWMRGLNLSPS